MKLLVDNGIVSSADFIEGAKDDQILRWRAGEITVSIAGFKRVEIDSNADQQEEKNALFTVGRLVRAGRLSLYTYSELNVEKWRRPRNRESLVNALGNCEFKSCPAAIERSKFRRTINMDEWFAKGGKADRKKGRALSDFNQIPYFEWLSSLSAEEIHFIVDHAHIFKLDDFEVASLRDLRWFQSLCSSLIGSDNLADCFHIWTARRNGLEVFLTLEQKLTRSVDSLRMRRQKIDIDVQVVRPTDLLRQLGIANLDAVPIECGRFYSYAEIFKINRELLAH